MQNSSRDTTPAQCKRAAGRSTSCTGAADPALHGHGCVAHVGNSHDGRWTRRPAGQSLASEANWRGSMRSKGCTSSARPVRRRPAAAALPTRPQVVDRLGRAARLIAPSRTFLPSLEQPSASVAPRAARVLHDVQLGGHESLLKRPGSINQIGATDLMRAQHSQKNTVAGRCGWPSRRGQLHT